jgi:O-antigen/teichoic acid export membrane protein
LALEDVLIGYAFIGALTAFGAVLLLRRLRTGRIHLSGHDEIPGDGLDALRQPSSSIVQTIFEAGPSALVTMFYVVSGQGVVVIVEWFRGGAEAAFFNAAFSVFAAAALVPNIIYVKFLASRICRWAAHDRERFEAVCHVGVVAMLALGLSLMLVTLICAHWLIPLLFGARFARSVPVIMILSAAIPLRFVQHAYSSLFVSREDTARKARYLGLSALAGLVTGVVLVRLFNVEGAALATLIAEAILLVLHVRGTARFIDGVSVPDTFRVRTLRTSLGQLMRSDKAHGLTDAVERCMGADT